MLKPRCDLFFQDIETFIKLTEEVKECIRLNLEYKKNEEAINVLNEYIYILIPLMHQLAYLRNGICSLNYQIDERNQDCPINYTTTISVLRQELAFLREISIFTKNYSYVSDELTYVSIEAINILNQAKPHESLYAAAAVKIDKAENDILEKVGDVEEVFRPFNLINGHCRVWNKQIEVGPFDIFNYKYNLINVNSQTQVILKSKTFDHFKNYRSITIEMKELFERT